MDIQKNDEKTFPFFTPTNVSSVLMIEDDEEFALLIRKRLHMESFQVETVRSLAAGLSLLKEKSFDLILLDLFLPDSEGMATFQKIASKAKDKPILILSGLSDEKLAEEAVQKGAQDFLLKDEINGRYLIRSIRFAIERHRIVEAWKRIGTYGFELATHDILTKLPNRLLFQDRLRKAIAQAKRNHAQIALLFIDVDNFKQINDTFGHATGDEALQEVAKRLLSCIREGDTAARLSGDEFVILLHDVMDGNDPQSVSVRIHEAFRLPVRVRDDNLPIQVSIGVSLFPQDGESAQALIESADKSMYWDKRH